MFNQILNKTALYKSCEGGVYTYELADGLNVYSFSIETDRVLFPQMKVSDIIALDAVTLRVFKIKFSGRLELDCTIDCNNEVLI
jgi:hypothetical protein